MSKTYTFSTDHTDLQYRNTEDCTIVRTITEPEENFDADSLPMHVIRFADGFQTECWPDELTENMPTPKLDASMARTPPWEPIPGTATVEYRDVL